MKVAVLYTKNLGDFLNVLPVLSGLSLSFNEKIDLVIADELNVVKGIREFLLNQKTTIFNSVHFRNSIYGFDITKYLMVMYSQDEMKTLTERPKLPLETLRHAKFINEKYNIGEWMIDEDFVLTVPKLNIDFDDTKYIVGDRWLKQTTDLRRSSHILKDSGLFDNEEKFLFLDYENDISHNAYMIAKSQKPYIGTFTGSSVVCDLLQHKQYVIYNDEIANWDNMPIEYSYWKNYFNSEFSSLHHISDPVFGTL